ncbi:MAG: InlB B-repeat-containing protein [Clostridia bacterium]
MKKGLLISFILIIIAAIVGYFALFYVKKYTISFDLNYETEQTVESIKDIEGTRLTLPQPIRDGFTFTGWYYDEEYTQPFELIKMPKKDVKLYASWDMYIITFNTNGGSNLLPYIKVKGTNIVAPTLPTKDSNRFLGWFTDATLTTEYVFSTMPEENLTLYASWMQICVVSFNMSGYEVIDTPETQILDAGNYVVDPNLSSSRAGYGLTGWYTEKECVNEWNFASDRADRDVTLYACWTQEFYTISFNNNGGEGITPATQQGLSYLTKITKPTVEPTYAGYVFCGWWLKDGVDFVQEWNFSSDLPSDDMTLYAGWGIVGSNELYNFYELSNCVKLVSYNSETITEETLVIPSYINGKKVLSIGTSAFDSMNSANDYNIDGASNVVLPEFLTTINDKAFYTCLSLTDIVIPSGVTSIGKMAFSNCYNMYDLILNEGLKNIGEKAFYQCTSLLTDGKLVIPSTCLSVEASSFEIAFVNKAIKELEIKNGVVLIGKSAFMYAYILKIDIPDSVERIEQEAFRYCYYLTRVDIGKGIQSIGNYAFSNCYSSMYISIDRKIPPTINAIGLFGTITADNQRPNFFITVPEGSIDAYKAVVNWNYYYSSRYITYYLDDSSITYPNRP